MLNVFAKSYNKWRVEKCVNLKTASNVQAIAVAEDRFTEGTYRIDNVCLKIKVYYCERKFGKTIWNNS